MRTMLMSVLAGVTITAAGCSTVYEGKYDFKEGWRVGTVESLNVDRVTDQTVVDCRNNLATGALATAKFVPVRRVVHGTHHGTVIALADQDLPLQAGDHVYVRVNDCTQRLVPIASVQAKTK